MGIAQGQAPAGGPFAGINPPPFQASHYYRPHWATATALTVTLTANRLYRTWFYVPKTTTFSGGWFHNSGAGDSGDKVRIGVYDATGATLLKDFGETTLSGAAALRSVANTVTLPGPAWYQLALVSDTTPALFAIDPLQYFSAAGMVTPSPTAAFGAFSAALAAGSNILNSSPVGDYAAFSYAALPTPITAPTATITMAGGSGQFPAIGLYV